MASAKKVVAVDFGSSTLKFAVFQVDSASGLGLLEYQIKELGVDPGKDEVRLPQMLGQLQDLVATYKCAGVPAICSLSGQFAFTRFVKLPPVSADQIDQMIGFEAQQNVPFPINEVVWDYQLLGGKGGSDYEALIVAIKDDFVEQAAAAVNASKLDLVTVDVSPLALINSYFYSQATDAGCTLLIDIGAKCSNLIFIEGRKVFARVIPIGGHMITQNISNEFQEPYQSAELLKKGKGFVGLGGAYADPDDQVAARISKIARSVYSRLHAEVSRSISFYRNQQGGKAPTRILLSGGSARLAYSDLFFKEKLNVPVEYFNPLCNVAIGPNLNRDQLATMAPLMGELVGLGLRHAGETPVEVMLVPASVEESKKKRAQMPMFVVGLVIFLAAFVVAAAVNEFQRMDVQRRVDSMRADLQQKTALSKKIEQSKTAFERAVLEADTIDRVVDQRNFWPRLLNTLASTAGSSVGLWITEMEVTANQAPLTAIPAAASSRPPNPRLPKRKQPAPVTPPVSEAKPVNFAPFGTELNIKGFFEAGLGYDFLNAFVQKLKATELFEDVKIESRENLEDQVALNFYIRATFKEEARLNLLP